MFTCDNSATKCSAFAHGAIEWRVLAWQTQMMGVREKLTRDQGGTTWLIIL